MEEERCGSIPNLDPLWNLVGTIPRYDYLDPRAMKLVKERKPVILENSGLIQVLMCDKKKCI
jgi:hypothetical protein